jgi:very-short-patch-repair endonuclease
VRTTPTGRVYLDVRWAGSHLVVEVDGSGHRAGLALTDDNLRQNELTLGDERVLRIDLVGLRLREADVMAQVRRGVSVDRGCV